MKSALTRILSIIVLLALVVTPVFGNDTLQTDGPRRGLDRSDLVPLGALPASDKYIAEEPDKLISLDKESTYIVLFEGDSLVVRTGGALQLDSKNITSEVYLKQLADKRKEVLDAAVKKLGRGLEVTHVYDVILNGAAVKMSAEEAAKLAGMPGIRKIMLSETQTLDTDAGPMWIGAGGIWDGTAVPDGVGNKGEGILVGMIDTGINFDHPSFSDEPADGFDYEWEGDYLGVCAPDGDPDYADACNDKLVGAYTYTEDNSDPITPEDSEGHGSHTASTVAGNAVEIEFQGETVTISGVAPHAQIIAYDACYPTPEGGSCAGDDLLAAVQQAVLDGVDIINYSISGGETPYSDPVELAFLEAFDAGVVVSASAGNDGPDAATVAHLSPWVITTAASTHNRKFTNQVNFSNPLYQGIATLAGEVPFSQEVLDSPVVYSGEDEGNDLGCEAFPADFFAGSIALIRRGTCNFSVKINNAAAAGATGVLMFTDNRAPGAMSASGTTIPNVMLDISGVLGQEIADWVAAQTDETVDVTPVGYYLNDAYGDIMADFSSRGPNRAFDVLKPDVSAPGMEILAAVADSTIAPSPNAEYDLYQGTSMSSPHDAGAAALLYAQHPDWTPAMIKSALMLTGYDGLIKEDKTTPADLFDMGAGRVALELAGLTGLVMDESYDNMLAADPDAGGDVRTLNIASLYNSECVGSCSWTRTFTSVANTSATYTVSAPAWVTVTPTSFTILPGATQEVTFEVDATALPGDVWAFGNIEFLTEDLFAGGDPIVLVEQDFTEETFPPTDWAIYDVDLGDPTPSNWARAIDQSYSAPASAKHKYDCTQLQEGWLVSPQFTVPADGTTSLQFFQRGNYAADMDYHGIMVSTGSGDPAVGDFVELVMPPTPPEDAWTTTPVTVDLSAYAEQQIYVAFVYEGNCADDWWIDDVLIFNQVTGTVPISDVAVPVAVLPVSGNIPDWVSFDSHRDADFATLSDLLAVEITDFTVDTFGFVKGEPNEIQLAQDPTNGDPFDNLDQVYYTLIDMTNGAARAVAEITATTAADLDLFWGFDINEDGMPQEGELYESSATATAFEYLSDWGFPVGFYDVWVLVQNWQGSGAPVDDITLTLGVVGYDMYADPSMQVIGPETNAAFVPFDLDVVWSGIDTEEGDRLYGLFDAYADAAYDVPIGLTEVDVVRGVDDVVKTADVETAVPGDTITYTLAVTNYKDYSIEYSINDVLPAGVTYVPDSVTGGAMYDELTNAITWTGTIDPGYYTYDATTSAEDPACTLEIMPDGNPDAYLDWLTTSYGFRTSASLAYGDSFWYGTFSTYPPFNYYGIDYVGMEFTADGYAGFDMASTSYNNQNLPNPTNPNNLMAMFWDDLYTQYDLATNKGVTMVGDGASFAVIEYDDVYRYGSSNTNTMDFEIGYFLQPDDAPGAYEIVFAYDNIHPDFNLGSSTIGVENVDGTVGTTFVYNDTTLEIENGSAICFDYVFVPPTHVITFQVTVDEEFAGPIVNEALHSTDEEYTVEETAIWEVLVPEPLKFIYLPLIMR